MDEHLLEYRNLTVALAVGLLIGLERGWSERGAEEGMRMAGIRTFGLIGLLGALWQLLAREQGVWLLAVAFLGFSLLVVGAAFLEIQHKRDYSITTGVAALITFALGALSMAGYLNLAAAVAVVIMVLLGLKPVLHGWLRKLEAHELSAVFKLSLISLVALPVLPDRAFDPWDALNPYEIWWMVVLISAISFVGYFASKIVGAGRGILLTGLFAGLVSSTAVALSMARLGKTAPRLQRLAAASVGVASATMFVRMALVVALVRPALLAGVGWPLAAMTVCGFVGVWLLLRNGVGDAPVAATELRNPFEFGMALRFGFLLAVVLLATHVLQDRFGSAGIYLMAGLAAVGDVDAVNLSLSRAATVSLAETVAVNAILLVAAINTLAKGVMVAAIAGGEMAKCVGWVYGLLLAAGGLALAATTWLA